MYEFLEYRVRDVMTPEPICIGPDEPISEAEKAFETHDFNALPVVDEQRHVHGILTKLDVLKAFAFDPKSIVPHYDDLMRSRVAERMTEDVVSVGSDAHLTRVLEVMTATRYTSLPVIDEGRIVGVIGREDILRALRRAVEGKLPKDRDV